MEIYIYIDYLYNPISHRKYFSASKRCPKYNSYMLALLQILYEFL